MFPFSLFQPRWLREARLMQKTARHLFHVKRDVLPKEANDELQKGLEDLKQAIAKRDEKAVETVSAALEKRFAPHATPSDSLREWTETIVVSIAVVVAFRAYFLQPFAIPTGSMQPTLNGRIVRQIAPDEPLPNIVQQWAERIFLGHTYVDYRAPRNEMIVALRSVTAMRGFFEQTEIQWASGDTVTLPIPIVQMQDSRGSGFGVETGRRYKDGQVVARGYMLSGDHVFVDRFTYHFRKPARSDVFVFRTAGIPGIGQGQVEGGRPVAGDFYIKRLAGIPGDELRIISPWLHINGKLAEETGFLRVGQREDGYGGYGNISAARYLRSPAETFTCGPKEYFALGDNSYNSSDSRFWRIVPEDNILGRGYFVYWPLGRHWGFIR